MLWNGCLRVVRDSGGSPGLEERPADWADRPYFPQHALPPGDFLASPYTYFYNPMYHTPLLRLTEPSLSPRDGARGVLSLFSRLFPTWPASCPRCAKARGAEDGSRRVCMRMSWFPGQVPGSSLWMRICMRRHGTMRTMAYTSCLSCLLSFAAA